MRRLLTVWFAWLVLMAGANLATPLYAVYAERFHFSSLVLTAIFATYAIVLVPALVLFGRLSDRFGRRPVVVAGLATACLGLALFAAAQGEVWLFTARAVQGLAVGMISGAATAALVELDPQGSRRRAALGAGLAQAGGSALGPLAAGVLAEWAPDPLRLCYLVALGLTLVAAALVLRLPEAREGEREPWRPQWPRVPAEVRRPFFRVGLTAGAVWAAMALFLSIVPSYTERLLSTRDLAVVAAIAALALLASFAAQAVVERREGSHRRDQAIGLVLLALGLGGVVGAAPSGSIALVVAGSVVAGVGHGVAFLTAQQELNELAPGERRGEVTAAFIACIYFTVASFVVASGLLGSVFSLDTAVETVGSVLIAVALGAAAWQVASGRADAPRRRAAAPRSAAARR
ncbi:MAG TPA: MFS transporter [Gaiellaceae bacterium]|nr:MFS transporter [Gaiellaceae bacterium]